LGTKAFNALYGNGIEDLATEEQDAIAAAMLALAGSAAVKTSAVTLVETPAESRCRFTRHRRVRGAAPPKRLPGSVDFEYQPTRQNTFDCLPRDRRASRGAVV
jgi:hypothetical protein